MIPAKWGWTCAGKIWRSPGNAGESVERELFLRTAPKSRRGSVSEGQGLASPSPVWASPQSGAK